MQVAPPGEAQPEPLLLQWLCLCLGKLWEGFPEAQLLGLSENATDICSPLLSEPQPEVIVKFNFTLHYLKLSCSGRSAVTLLDTGTEPSRDGYCYDDDDEDDERSKVEQDIAKHLLEVLSDGSPLVRAELAIGISNSNIKY